MPYVDRFEFWIALIAVAFVAGFFWAFGSWLFARVNSEVHSR